MPQLAEIKLHYWEHTSQSFPDEGVWEGKFVEIVFHNTSKIHCDLKDYKYVIPSSDGGGVDIKSSCYRKDNDWWSV